MCLCFFFLSCNRYHRDLHSFPTRRSSDLVLTVFTGKLIPCPTKPSFGPWRLAKTIASTPAARRSEEHTSELQSHSDLVCRLLLEKKNITDVHEIQRRGVDDAIARALRRVV